MIRLIRLKGVWLHWKVILRASRIISLRQLANKMRWWKMRLRILRAVTFITRLLRRTISLMSLIQILIFSILHRLIEIWINILSTILCAFTRYFFVHFKIVLALIWSITNIINSWYLWSLSFLIIYDWRCLCHKLLCLRSFLFKVILFMYLLNYFFILILNVFYFFL